MKFDGRQIARVLVDQLDNVSDQEMKSMIKEFVKFIAEQKLLSKWREIENSIEKVWKEKYGASKVNVISAHELSKKAKTELEKIAPGADMEYQIDSGIIGGAILRIDDKRIDGSVSGALKRLRSSML